MSNVVAFPTAKAASSYILIDSGWTPSASGRQDLEVVTYFVSLVEPGKGETCVWDGPTHKDAVFEARSWDMPIVDNVADAAGGSA